MSENKELQLVNFNHEEEEKKISAWGKFGAKLYKTELKLQLQAQEIISQLVDPISKDLIAKAEVSYAYAKKMRNELQAARIEVTINFDKPLQRLMTPEKDIDKALEENRQAIIKAKQRLAESAKLEENKAKELKEIAAKVRLYVADMHANYLNAQLKLVSDGYKYALAQEYKGEAFKEFLVKLKARITIKNREMPRPIFNAEYNTQEIISAEVEKNFNPWNPQQYVDGFALDVDNKFTDWEQALKNKEAAAKINDQETAETIAAINDDKSKEEIAAKLEAIAMPLIENSDTKPLKETWVISDPETLDEMFTIVNAFAINRNLVEKEIGARIKPANIGIKQMIAALVSIKDKDDAFECTGIKFSKKDKL